MLECICENVLFIKHYKPQLAFIYILLLIKKNYINHLKSFFFEEFVFQ